jgi:MFS family permease
MTTIGLDKRGDLTGVLYLIVILAGFAFFVLLVGFIGDTISEEMKDVINSTNPEINDAFNTTNNLANNSMSIVWFIAFFGILLSLFITSWFIPTHPIFVPIFIVLLIIAVILGIAMSNAYEEFYTSDTFAGVADSQSSINFLMSNLPYVAMVIGFISLIITFAKPGRGEVMA